MTQAKVPISTQIEILMALRDDAKLVNTGAPINSINRLKQLVNRHSLFPDELADLLLVRNGDPAGIKHGLLEEWLWQYSVDEIYETYETQLELVKNDEKTDFICYCNTDIQIRVASDVSKYWIPFLECGEYDFYFDMKPDEAGFQGQIIHAQAEFGAAWFVSDSLSSFLDLYIQSIQLGYESPFVDRHIVYSGVDMPDLFRVREKIKHRT